MPTIPDPKQNRTGQVRLVRCALCGRTEECSPQALLSFTRKGWPKCCGDVMTFFVEAEKPDQNDTKLDTPQLPPTE